MMYFGLHIKDKVVASLYAVALVQEKIDFRFEGLDDGAKFLVDVGVTKVAKRLLYEAHEEAKEVGRNVADEA